MTHLKAHVGDLLILAHRILQDHLIPEDECNSVDFEAIYSRKSLSELLEEIYARLNKGTESENEWRRVALQFDGHRLAMRHHLRMLLEAPTVHRAAAKAFLAAPPLSGEQVLAERIKALAPGGLTDAHRAVIAEAAQVLESAAAHNRSKGRTVMEHTQQDRADRLRAILELKEKT